MQAFQLIFFNNKTLSQKWARLAFEYCLQKLHDENIDIKQTKTIDDAYTFFLRFPI